jgi:hypothetical protein
VQAFDYLEDSDIIDMVLAGDKLLVIEDYYNG